jgi:3-dehydroquinate dehydratase-1
MKFPDTSPVILGTVTTPAGLRALARTSLPAHAVEVRVDALLAAGVPVATIEKALRGKKHPALITLRIPAEGGRRAWKVKERRELFLRLLPLAEAIDVELATARAMTAPIEAARRAGKTVVLSAHAIKRPAPPARMAKWVAQYEAEAGPGTILKVAVRMKSWRDLQQLAGLLMNHPDWAIAVMGIGPFAAQSRSVLTALGSRLVYGYLDQPVAPGQPSAAEMSKVAAEVRTLKSAI